MNILFTKLKISRVDVPGFLAIVLFSVQIHAATCSFVIKDKWDSGFKAEVSIANDGDAFSSWQLSWSWSDSTSINNHWNADIVCDNAGCVATPPEWEPVINTGGVYKFGFVANKGNSAVQIPQINGDVCDSNNSTNTNWWINASESNLSYLSFKKDHVAELNHFSRIEGNVTPFSGSITADGEALLKIDLNSIESSVEIRNSRLLAFLFETGSLPDAWFSTAISPDLISSLAPGETTIVPIVGQLILHAVSQTISANVMVTKLSSGKISVTTTKPVIIGALNFDMAGGIETLKQIASLSSISRTVPVYFHLVFETQTNGQSSLDIPQTPDAPDGLSVDFDDTDLSNDISWQDNSDLESHYLIRRRTIDGFWQTSTELGANARQASESLADTGNFEYKIIAVNNSIPSAPSATVAVEVTQGNPIIRGQTIFKSDCAGCHGTAGEGIGGIPALNVEMDFDMVLGPMSQSYSSVKTECNFLLNMTHGNAGHGRMPLILSHSWNGDSYDVIMGRELGPALPFQYVNLGVHSNGNGYLTRDGRNQIRFQDNPFNAFKLLFGSGQNQNPKTAILDAHAAAVNTIKDQLTGYERQRMDDHLDAISDTQKRLNELGGSNTCPTVPSSSEFPITHDYFSQQAFRQIDIAVAALQCNITSSVSIAYGNHQSLFRIPELNYQGLHHQSIHGGSGGRVNYPHYVEMRNHMGSYTAYLIQRLKNVGILDSTVVLETTDMAHADLHSATDAPFMIAGGGNTVRRGVTTATGGSYDHWDVLHTAAKACGVDLGFGSEIAGVLA